MVSHNYLDTTFIMKKSLHKSADDLTLAVKWLIHYSDGTNSLKKISKLSGINFSNLKKAFNVLQKAKILKKIS